MSEETEIECPNGCPPGGRRGHICLLCYGSGWVSLSMFEEVRAERDKRGDFVEVKIETSRRYDFGVDGRQAGRGMKSFDELVREPGQTIAEWAEANLNIREGR